MTPNEVVAPAKLWTIVELAEWLGVPTEEAWAAVRELGVPYLHYGKGTPDLNKRGARKIRFSPVRVAAWAEQNMAVWGSPKPVETPVASEPVIPAGIIEGYGSFSKPPKRRGPRK